ncbi:MAG: protein translocase subunit SecF [Acidobacteria bacterium]|nr:MAG: protein translocase subunit SecF [Acidobacteriota bacterium]
MEIFRDVSIDWLGKKWYFLGASWVLFALGVIGYFVRGGFAYGIDFTGGTIIYLKFNSAPDLDRIRKALKPEAVGTTIIQSYGEPGDNSVQVRLATVFEASQDVDSGQRAVQKLLREAFDAEKGGSGNADFNNVAVDPVAQYLIQADPDNLKAQSKTIGEIETHYRTVAAALLDYRNKTRGGLVSSMDELAKARGVSQQVVESLKKNFYAGPFAIKGVESVGAVVGSDLRRRAALAVGLSFLGMLIYIAFRFKPIYGVAAIVALLHDVGITLGLFAITRKELSLTVIAALLTLVGYSVNDTIVVFDRVRENLRLMRKESLSRILNISINQTLSRTIMTSGVTFLSVLALFLFGGEVLNGFSFTLTVGIIVGTYSSIAIAAPIVDFWYRSVNQRTGRKAAA